MEEQYEGHICTVVSCLPFVVNKNIPHCYPGNFRIPEVKDVWKDIELLHVGSTMCQYYVGGEAGDRNDGWIKKTIPSEELAQAICMDEVASCIDITLGIAQPAIFWLHNKLTPEEVILKHYDKIKEVREQQKRWFIELVRQADIDFGKIKSPGAVSELQRKAAKFLNLRKEWDIDVQVENIMACPSCNEIVNPAAIMCKNCKYILNESVYKTMKDRFATPEVVNR